MCFVASLIILLVLGVLHTTAQTKPELIRYPEDSYPARGKQLSLKCQANGIPNPDISWFKDGKLVQTQRDKPGTSNRILTNGELLFLAFNPDDEGKYYCNASNNRGWSVSPTFTVKMAFFNPESARSPSSKVVNAGDQVTLECSLPIAQPQPSVSWNHDGVKIRIDDVIYSLLAGDLRIKHVTTSHSGIYFCSAENIAGSWRSGDASLIVHRKPRFDYTRNNKSALAGDNVVFECSGADDPDAHVVWRRSESLHIRSSFIRGNQLQFENVQMEDAGIYVCEINLNDQLIKENFYLRVIPEPSFSLTPEDKHVFLGDDVVMDCLLEGIPKPIIRWLHNRDTIWVPMNSNSSTDIDRYRVFPNGTLLIRGISFYESGIYECRASRSSWVKKSSASISVNFYTDIPLIQVGPQNATLLLGQSTVLHCRVVRLHYPSVHHPYILPNDTSVNHGIKIIWSLNGTRIYPTENVFKIDSTTGSLHIGPITHSHAGLYTCEASFLDPLRQTGPRMTSWSCFIRIDDDENDRNALLSTLPSPPTGLSISEVGDTWAILTLPDEIPGQILPQAVRIETAILNHTTGWVMSVPYTENKTILLMDLQPLTIYHVLVRSISQAGVGIPLVLNDLVSTKESVHVSNESPHIFSSLMGALQFGTVFSRSISPSEVLVYSSLCGPDTLLSQVSKFTVTAHAVPISYCLSNNAYLHDTDIPKQIDSTCTSRPITIDDLLKNDIDDLPHCIDEDLSDSYTLNRLPPASLDRMYTYSVSKSDMKNRSTPGLVIGGLSPFMCYSVQFGFIASHNIPSHTFHKHSEESFVLTYESKPRGAPEVINVSWLLNGTVLEITFDAPSLWEQSGILFGFTVRIISSIMSARRIVRLGPTTRVYHLYHLSPWTKYDIYLAAVNCRGEGVHSFPIEVFALDPPSTSAHPAQRKIVFGNRTASQNDNSPPLVHELKDPEYEYPWNWIQQPWFIMTVISIFILWFIIVLGLILLGRYRSRIQHSRSLNMGDGFGKNLKNGDLIVSPEARPLVSTDDMMQYNEKSAFIDLGYSSGGFPKTNGTLALSSSKSASIDKPMGFGLTSYTPQYTLNGTTYASANGRSMHVPNNNMHYPLPAANFRPLPVPMPQNATPGVRYDPLAIQSNMDDDDSVAAYASVPIMQQMIVHDRSHATNSSGSRGAHSAGSGLDATRPANLADIIPPPPNSPPPSLPSASPPINRKMSNPSTKWSHSGGSGEDSAYYAHSELHPNSSQQTSRHQFIPSIPSGGGKWSCSVPASDESSTLLTRHDMYPDGPVLLPPGNHAMNLSTVVVRNNSFTS